MNSDDIDFISRTETIRNFSNLFLYSSGIFLLYLEGWLPTISGSILHDSIPSATSCIVLALLGIGLRLIAIDRFLRMARQIDWQSRQMEVSDQ